MRHLPAAIAYWMKRSTVFASRESSSAWDRSPCTSPANCVANAVWSNCVIGPMPDLPASEPLHVSSVPMASGVTSPMPVTTTLRAMRCDLPPSRARPATYLACALM